MDFATYLAACLKKREFSQHDYAKLTGISRSRISNILRGERTPPLTQLSALLKPLRLNGEELAEFRFLASAAHIPEELARAAVIAVFYSQRDMAKRLQRLETLMQSEVASPEN